MKNEHEEACETSYELHEKIAPIHTHATTPANPTASPPQPPPPQAKHEQT